MRAFPHGTTPSGPGAPARSPVPPTQLQQQQQPPPSHSRVGSFPLRQSSLSSESSDSSQITSLATTPKPSYATHHAATESSSSISSTPRNATPNQLNQARTFQQDSPLRQPPSNMSPPNNFGRDRSRQHSQGFFEPTLPTASHRDPSIMTNSNLSASQIAAQAAMHVQNGRHDRRRSQTSMEPLQASSMSAASRKPKTMAPIQTQQTVSAFPSSSVKPVQSGVSSGGSMKSAATTAASAAFPRSPLGSPFAPFASDSRPASPSQLDQGKPEKEKTSRRKLFSKPNKLHISKEKDAGKSVPKTAGLYGSSTNLAAFNYSTTSLADFPQTPATAIYSNANASTSTLVPSDRGFGLEKEKEKHRHHFLSRQKNKLKDDHAIALSSASSNSRPIDPSAPQSLYSFAPSSPSLASKSISGLDLRHGGRALREKKKEEKAAQSSTFNISMPQPPSTTADAINRTDTGDLAALFGPMSNTSQTSYGADHGIPSQNFTGFGLQNMGIDDAWPLLKARLLNIFEGEDLRTPIEDFNRLANAHVQRSIMRRSPGTLIDDVRDLFNTGFASLDMALRNISDDRLVLHLVETWAFVFGNILPFMQAVFLPLDLEFKGQGSLLKDPTEAAEFWGAAVASMTRPGTANTDSTINKAGAQRMILDIRTLVLHSFRSNVILPRHDVLLTIFSRLSLDAISTPSFPDLPTPPVLGARPGTAASSGSGGLVDPSSYNSQGSTLLDSSTAGSFGARSRATSNTSAGSFHSLPSRGRERAGTNHSLTSAMPLASAAMAMDSGRVTATAARMLQCVSVLAGLGRVGDDEEGEATARKKMERLAKELKLNWLGRSRMGRDRRGLVGTKVRGPLGVGIGVGA